MSKRGAPQHEDGVLVKRARSSPPPSTQIAISSSNDERSKSLIRSVKRTSNLEAPIISLAGAHSVCILISFMIFRTNRQGNRAKFSAVGLILLDKTSQLAQPIAASVRLLCRPLISSYSFNELNISSLEDLPTEY
jgi:hypothetical protein